MAQSLLVFSKGRDGRGRVGKFEKFRIAQFE